PYEMPWATAKELISELSRWDAADSATRKLAAEAVARRRGDVVLVELTPYKMDSRSREVAVFEHGATSLHFALVPGGTFVMGSPPDEKKRDDKYEVQHEVRLSP